MLVIVVLCIVGWLVDSWFFGGCDSCDSGIGIGYFVLVMVL